MEILFWFNEKFSFDLDDFTIGESMANNSVY
jgi:hypothetical protein